MHKHYGEQWDFFGSKAETTEIETETMAQVAGRTRDENRKRCAANHWLFGRSVRRECRFDLCPALPGDESDWGHRVSTQVEMALFAPIKMSNF